MAYDMRYRKENTNYNYGTSAPEIRKKEAQIDEREYLRRARTLVNEKARAKAAERRTFSFLQCVVITAALFAVIGLSSLYIVQLSVNHTAKSKVTSLTKQVRELHEENLLLQNEEAGRIDYDAVYSYATEELGMSIPGKQQVIYYKQRASEYVTVSAEIPNE